MKVLLIVSTLALGLYSTPSLAQLFRLNVTNCGSLTTSQCDQLRVEMGQVEQTINEDFPSTSDPKRLMEGMANSSVMAGKGIGSDYASRMEVFLIGAGVGVGADMEKDQETGSDLSGAGVQGGLIIGTNLSWMDANKILGLYTDRLNVYMNYLGHNLERKLGDEEKDTVEADLRSMGLHVSYDLVMPSGSSLLRWGGLKVHTGYEYNTTNITFKSQLSESFSEDVDTGAGTVTASGTINGKPAATIDVATQSIPLEVSTSVQLGYILSLYTGLGVDFNFGKASSEGNLNADESTLLVNGSDTGTRVQADANVNGSGSPNSVLTRGFVGVQINLPYTNIFVQANKAFGTELVGATAGLRFVY